MADELHGLLSTETAQTSAAKIYAARESVIVAGGSNNPLRW